MLRLSSIDALDGLLLRVPLLVQSFEDSDIQFLADLKAWFKEVETLLFNNRLGIASEIAAYRAELISIERGNFDHRVGMGRRTRKDREARSITLLRQSAELVQSSIKGRRTQVEEAERAMLQIVAISYRLGLISNDPSVGHSAQLENNWRVISTRPEIASLVVHVLGLLGYGDTLVMFDRALARYVAT